MGGSGPNARSPRTGALLELYCSKVILTPFAVLAPEPHAEAPSPPGHSGNATPRSLGECPSLTLSSRLRSETYEQPTHEVTG